MKKILSVILCLSVLLASGCSNVTQEDYNSLVEEKSNLKSENDQLKGELNELKESKTEIDDCFEIYAKVLSLPKSAISEEHSKQHSRGLYEEDTFYNNNNELTSKVVLTFDSSLSGKDIAPYIKAHVDGINNDINQLLQSSLTANVCIYRYSNGNVIMSQCWYKDEEGNINAPMFFTSYGKEAAEEISRLYKEEISE